MVKVIGVRFRNAGKIYFFDPGDLRIKEGDDVIVETSRGVEFGNVARGVDHVKESEIVAPLKPVIRLATEKDVRQHENNLKKKERAMRLCQEKIDKHKLEMKLVDVEYIFDNNKIIFYFTADGRVDFRELVKDLAGVFRMRIELRQIGVRDVAKMLGGIGSCGRNLCCNQWLSGFHTVSIKMAKAQNLSLNPTKISGVCGRLMCCLKYENDLYMEMKKGMPDNGERVKTPDGIGVVVDTNILEDKIKIRLVLEEATEEQEEKLDTDTIIYSKKEIRRLSKNKKRNGKNQRSGRGKSGNQKISNDDMEGLDEATKKEIEILMKD